VAQKSLHICLGKQQQLHTQLHSHTPKPDGEAEGEGDGAGVEASSERSAAELTECE